MKDSTEIIEFMALFQKLRDLTDDDPVSLEKLAADDESLKQRCIDLFFKGHALSEQERRQRRLFSSPVNPKFIEAWRAYETRYASHMLNVFLPGIDLDPLTDENKLRADIYWEGADEKAKDQSNAIDRAINFAYDQVTDEGQDFGEGFQEKIEDGATAWDWLTKETGFNLQGIFRRRTLVPFVLIPRHVSQHHGDAERLSLLTHLQEAHDAFIFGLQFAALALMRSVLETTLKTHYHACGTDLAERIDICENLPDRCKKQTLHRIRKLANDILHMEKEKTLPKDLEPEVLRLLNVLRALIEGAPILRS